MPVTGVVAALLAKLTGAGTAAKAALAGATLVATMGVAGAAAGVLPTPFQIPDGGGTTGAVERAVAAVPKVDVTLPTIPKVSVPTVPPVTASAKASTSPTAASPVVTPTVPNVSIPSVTLPPAVAAKLPACVANLIPAGGGTPDPAKLAAQIPSCIPQVLATAGLPKDIATCISSVLGSIGGANGMSPASVPNIGSLQLSTCVPIDASKCVTSMLSLLASLPGAGSGIPGLGSIPGMGSIPALSTVTGCVPMNVNACISSITAAVSAGAAPKLDLSACLPTTLPTGAIPGIGSFPGLPGLGGAIPFFGSLPFAGR